MQAGLRKGFSPVPQSVALITEIGESLCIDCTAFHESREIFDVLFINPLDLDSSFHHERAQEADEFRAVPERTCNITPTGKAFTQKDHVRRAVAVVLCERHRQT